MSQSTKRKQPQKMARSKRDKLVEYFLVGLIVVVIIIGAIL